MVTGSSSGGRPEGVCQAAGPQGPPAESRLYDPKIDFFTTGSQDGAFEVRKQAVRERRTGVINSPDRSPWWDEMGADPKIKDHLRAIGLEG